MQISSILLSAKSDLLLPDLVYSSLSTIYVDLTIRGCDPAECHSSDTTTRTRLPPREAATRHTPASLAPALPRK